MVKGERRMEWIDRLNEAIRYIEENLTGKIEYEKLGRIVTEWLPTSGYEFMEGPDIEVYFNPDPRDTAYEVWIPVKKKHASV